MLATIYAVGVMSILWLMLGAFALMGVADEVDRLESRNSRRLVILCALGPIVWIGAALMWTAESVVRLLVRYYEDWGKP